MKVHLNQIPPEGLHVEGEDPAEILELHDPNVTPAGPVRCSLNVGLSDGGLFATGEVGVDLDLVCVSCLEKFRYPLRVRDFAMQMELTGAETVDLTPQIREDTLLALPAYPHCDWDGQKTCKGPALEVMKNDDVPSEAPPPAWDALDQLKFKSK